MRVMNKDLIFAQTLSQQATVISQTYSTDNKYNRPLPAETQIDYACRIARKSGTYLNSSNAPSTTDNKFRAYFEVDAVIEEGNTIIVDNIKYRAGLVYKPLNHHLEVDISLIAEA